MWDLQAEPDEVYAALAEIGDYPWWWPEVRTVTKIDDVSCEVRCRSLLPYDLVFMSLQSRKDPEARVLEAVLRGDLDGFSRWTIDSAHSGSRLIFDEEVVVTKPLLRRLALLARPAFKANHAVMMRHGRKGLRAYLAGYKLGRTGSTTA